MELKDRHKRVRCIDPKNNKVKNIPAHAVAECVKTYGLIVQDLDELKELPELTGKEQAEYRNIKNDPTVKIPANMLENLVEVDVEKVRLEYEELTGKPAGRKNLETLLKEIEKIKNKK